MGCGPREHVRVWRSDGEDRKARLQQQPWEGGAKRDTTREKAWEDWLDRGWVAVDDQSKQTNKADHSRQCEIPFVPRTTSPFCHLCRRRRRPSNSGVCDPRRGILTPCHAQPPVNNCVSAHGPRT